MHQRQKLCFFYCIYLNRVQNTIHLQLRILWMRKYANKPLKIFQMNIKNLTTGLATQAKKLIPTILMQQSELFYFKHQIICNAVGNYLFVEHFKMASEAFPIETFVDQDFSTVTEKQSSEICVRLIREVVENSHVSTVFSCIALKESSFAQIFCSHLREHDVHLRRQLFAATGKPFSQFKFPVTFWVSKNECFHLAMLMTEMISENDIDRDIHFYASLFGDCCASDESLFKDANKTTLKDV